MNWTEAYTLVAVLVSRKKHPFVHPHCKAVPEPPASQHRRGLVPNPT